jgi:threonine dehydratase
LTDTAYLQQAEAVVRRFFPPTPLLFAPRLSERIGTEVYVKLESCTPIRTFKLRGALVKLQSLVDQGVEGGVITASAGNHGLAVATAARLFGRPAVVCVPQNANPQKIGLIEQAGAQVVMHGEDYQEAFERCLQIGQAERLTLVHAYDDPAVIAGQGTIGLELCRSGIDFDTVVMGIGGGGLIAGIGAAIKALRPEAKVIGVEPEGAPAMYRSLQAGRLVELERVQTMADGLAARRVGEYTLAYAQRFVDRVELVSEEDLWAAMRFLLREERQVVEPAGAAGTAWLLQSGSADLGRVVVVLSGANIADTIFAALLV